MQMMTVKKAKQTSIPAWWGKKDVPMCGIFGKLIRIGGAFLCLALLEGCAGTSAHMTDKFMGEGFSVSLPNSRERVVVWGNHSGAVNRALSWLHDKDLIVVDPSWVEKGFKDPGFARRTRSQQKSQVLEVANDVGASVVVFAHVEENQVARKFEVMSWSNKTLKIVNVEIRGMNAKTGEVMFGSKVWNSEPLAISEDLILDLTTMAMDRAWQQADPPTVLVKNETPESDAMSEPPAQREQVTVYPQSQTPETEQRVETPQPVVTAVQDAGSTPPGEQDPQSPQAQTTMNSEPRETIQEPSQASEVKEESAPQKSEESVIETKEEDESSESSLGIKVASGALTILYAPLKIVYAGLGGIFGGFAYVLTGGNTKVSQSIWDSSLKGDYWVSPEHLEGERPIEFQGSS